MTIYSSVAALVLLASQSLAQNPWYWGAQVGLEFHVHQDDGCITSGEFAGRHKYAARLWDIPSGTDWTAACRDAPHILAGVTYPTPHRCVDEGLFGGMWGEWYIRDTKCEAEIGNQPEFKRGIDDPLKRPGPLRGYMDMHAHFMSHLGFGGVIFKGAPYGTPEDALPDCPSRSLFEPNLGGHSRVEAVLLDDIVGAVLNLHTHSNKGNPNFEYWPRPNTYTHQAIYYKWLQRAYEGGMRSVVVPCVNGDFMFGKHDNGLPDIIKGIPIASNPIYDLDDMDTLRRQIVGMYEMQAWIDAENGGDGEGWFRIVTTPEEYRKVVGEGKLAVILATEVDYPMSCRPGACNEQDITDGVQELWDLGIRYVFPIHLKTNDFGGAGKYNILVAADTYSCHGYSQSCNELGLTDKGHFLMDTLASRGMIIDIGHHGRLAFYDALDHAEAISYPGIVSGHAWFADIIHSGGRTEITSQADMLRRIVDLGGMIGIIAGQGKLSWVAEYYPNDPEDTFVPHGCGESSQSFAQAWLYLKDLLGDRIYDGRMTIGTDFNGFAHMPGARFGDNACYGGNSAMIQPESSKVQYPFTLDPQLQVAFTLDGQPPSFDLYTFGERTYDFNFDGAAHMGMLPDFFEDLRQQGLKRSDLEPLYRSAEFYVSMWESAIVRSVQLSNGVAPLENLQTTANVILRQIPVVPVVIATICFVVLVLSVVFYLRRRDAKQQQRHHPLLDMDSLTA